VATVNRAILSRRWTRPYAITLSDTPATKNCQRDGRPYRWIQNVGTAGLVLFVWGPSGDTASLWFDKGFTMEMGSLLEHAMDAGTDAGVDLRGLVGMEGRE
jgi:hypothetical protein